VSPAVPPRFRRLATRAVAPLALLSAVACARPPAPGTTVATTSAAAAPGARPRFMLVVHGGAGTIRRADMTPAMDSLYRAAMTAAIRTGYEVLNRGGSSLDAVVATVKTMEDDSLFNAGKGAVFTSAGTNELDAAVMDGRTLGAGAVAGLRHIRNPIELARLVMEKSPHVMLIGAGAEEFARSQGMAFVDSSYFYTRRRWDALQKAKAAEAANPGGGLAALRPDEGKYGTVGAVALDANGDIAAATTTGGTTNKRWGRVGDAPIIGAGTYANNESCAVSATGTGEFFIRNIVASDICARMRYGGRTLAQAADEVVNQVLVRQNGDGGVIAIDRQGNVATPFNTEGMYRGWVGPDGRITVRIYKDEQ
jgi:beta-aspartyl-peptidase (threonine type)